MNFQDKKIMSTVAITSLGHYLPQRRLTNHELEQMVDTSDEWITVRTGIKERRVADGEKTSDMAIKAANEAIEKAGLDPHKIELIIVGTVSPDSNFPSVACLVQSALGARHAAAFDVSAACSGFLFALTTAKQYLQNGMFKNALVIAVDKFTNLVDWNDRSTCVLFGDGAGACVLQCVENSNGEILSDYMFSLGAQGEFMKVVVEDRKPLDQKTEKIKFPYAVMRGQELFKVAVNSMAAAVVIAARRANVKVEDIECVVPHQANDRIISAVAKKLKIPKEKFFINIQKYGNMSAASIAIALYEAVAEEKIKKGDHVALVTFGAGLTAAANIVKW